MPKGERVAVANWENYYPDLEGACGFLERFARRKKNAFFFKSNLYPGSKKTDSKMRNIDKRALTFFALTFLR